MHACMHALLVHSALYQITWIRGFVIISGCFCNVCMHACMHPCMHCRYISLTPNTLIQCFLIIFRCVCNACMHALLIHSTHTKNPESGFCHYNLLCLQRIHSCIADTFNLHQILWIMVFVIISCTVCNAWMHALLIHSTHNKNPESGFCHYNLLCLQWIHSCIADRYIHFTPNTLNQGFYQYIPLFAMHACMHACMHCWYIQLIPNNLNQGFLSLYIRLFLQRMHACMHACMHAFQIHFTYSKYPDSVFPHYIPLCLHCMHACIADTFNSHQ